jgi:hypothetical protein
MEKNNVGYFWLRTIVSKNAQTEGFAPIRGSLAIWLWAMGWLPLPSLGGATKGRGAVMDVFKILDAYSSRARLFPAIIAAALAMAAPALLIFWKALALSNTIVSDAVLIGTD